MNIKIDFNFQDLSIIIGSTVGLFLHVILELCCPAIVVEKIKYEVEAIKLELHNQLLLDRG